MSVFHSALNFCAFIETLRQRKDLVDVEVIVDPTLEVAAIIRRVYEERLPAPMFHNLVGAMPGARILGVPAGMLSSKHLAYSRLAPHFGLPENTTAQELIEKIRSAIKAKPIDPIVVKTGPVKESMWFGDDVDLTKFPVPLLHETDGGRYFGTYSFHVVQSPEGT